MFPISGVEPDVGGGVAGREVDGCFFEELFFRDDGDDDDF